MAHALGQRFSKYRPRTSCGPRDLPLWSFKKYTRKIQIQINCLSHYSWNCRVWKRHMTIAFHSPPNTSILWNLLPYPSTDFPLYSQQQKRDSKHYELVFLAIFPCTSGITPVAQLVATRIQNGEPKYWTFSCTVFMTFLIVLPTQACTLKWSCTVRRTSIIGRAKCTGIKICYKIDKFAFGGNKSKVVHETVLT